LTKIKTTVKTRRPYNRQPREGGGFRRGLGESKVFEDQGGKGSRAGGVETRENCAGVGAQKKR